MLRLVSASISLALASIKKKLPDFDSLPSLSYSLSHSFYLSFSGAFSPTKYVFICVNFCQKDSGNYHVWATGFPYFSLRSLLPQGELGGWGVGPCSALELKEVWDFSRVLCINYRPTRRVPNQCLHFYLFCSVGELWSWSKGDSLGFAVITNRNFWLRHHLPANFE